MTTIKAQIVAEIVDAMRLLGAKSDLTAIIGSYGDTRSDEDVLAALRHWNHDRRAKRLKKAFPEFAKRRE